MCFMMKEFCMFVRPRGYKQCVLAVLDKSLKQLWIFTVLFVACPRLEGHQCQLLSKIKVLFDQGRCNEIKRVLVIYKQHREKRTQIHFINIQFLLALCSTNTWSQHIHKQSCAFLHEYIKTEVIHSSRNGASSCPDLCRPSWPSRCRK